MNNKYREIILFTILLIVIIIVIDIVFNYRDIFMENYNIIKKLKLQSPIYKRLAAYGHLGRNNCSWEEIDTVDDILSQIKMRKQLF